MDLAGEYLKGETSVKKLELFEFVSRRAGEFLSFRKWAYLDRRKSQVLIFCFFFIKEKEKDNINDQRMLICDFWIKMKSEKRCKLSMINLQLINTHQDPLERVVYNIYYEQKVFLFNLLTDNW